MTKVAYLECPTGIAGDMCLGALIDAGVPLEYLSEQLQRLGISQEFHLRVERVSRNGQAATKVHVDLLKSDPTAESKEPGVDPHTTFAHSDREEVVAQPTVSRSQNTHAHSADSHHHSNTTYSHSHPHGSEHSHSSSPNQVHDHTDAAVDHTHQGRHLPEIEQMIQVANLPSRASTWSLAVFRRLAAAEGAVHGIAPEAVHFHEVGATDAIVDIVGTCLGLDWLGIDTLYCAPLPVGGGTIWAAHGRLPVPTPAVLRLFEMRQVPIYSNGIERELVTPTGAAIATTLATEFGAPPPMRLLKVGLGAGSRDLPIPNILRLWVGESESQEPQGRKQASRPAGEVKPENAAARETIAVLETQIDDLNPQAIAYTLEQLFAIGALDVFTQAIAMKKSRLGTLLTVICHPQQIEACEAVLFRETTTLGIRRSLQERTILQREIQSVQTRFGAVRVKVARPAAAEQVINVQPEYEDCAQLARRAQVPFLEVHQAALQAWHQGDKTAG